MQMVFRYFFDPGSGTCLWSANAETEARYDYPVDHHTLPISAALKQRLDRLTQWFDNDYDWDNPAGEGKWSDSEQQAFWREAAATLASLREELPLPGIEIRNELRPA